MKLLFDQNLPTQLKRTLVLMALMSASSIASVADTYAFHVEQPEAGWIGVVSGELRLVVGRAWPGKREYRIWTADHKTGPVSLWADATAPTFDKPRAYLGWDDSGDEPKLELKPAVQPEAWEWEQIGSRGDTAYTRLRTASGKFKGRYVGSTGNAAEAVLTPGQTPATTYRLQLVERPEQALKFAVYVVSK